LDLTPPASWISVPLWNISLSTPGSKLWLSWHPPPPFLLHECLLLLPLLFYYHSTWRTKLFPCSQSCLNL
jgi:hypothetical protein